MKSPQPTCLECRTIYIVACQAHPALVIIGLVLPRPFIFNGLLVRLHVGLRMACVCYLCTD